MRAAAAIAVAVALAGCDAPRQSAAGATPLPPAPPPAEPTGPTPLPPGRVPTTPEIAHLTLHIGDGSRPDSVALRRGRFAGLVGRDSVVAELLAADGTALADTGRAATGDLDGDGSIEAAPVLAIRRGDAVTQRLLVVGARDGILGELASAPLGPTHGVRQVALVATRVGGDVRVTLGAGSGASEVRWYRFTRTKSGGARLEMLADTAGAAAAPRGVDQAPPPIAGHHHP